MSVIIFGMITALLIFTIAGIAIGLHRLVYDAVDNYDSYGKTPHEDWVQFERMKLGGRN